MSALSLYQDTVTVIDLVLDDLSCEALEGLDPCLQLLILILDFDLLITFCMPRSSQQGQTAFLGFIFPEA